METFYGATIKDNRKINKNFNYRIKGYSLEVEYDP